MVHELQRIQEENDKIEEEEKKLSAEEMLKRWEQLACEANQLLVYKRGRMDDLVYMKLPRIEKVYGKIQHRINQAIRIIKERISEYNII